MKTLQRVMEMVRKSIPDLDERICQFEVEPFEMDDELIAAFCEELDRFTADLRSGLDAANNETARIAVHSIKGMGGTMGLPEISVLAQEIEMTIRADDLKRAHQLSDILIAWARDFSANARA